MDPGRDVRVQVLVHTWGSRAQGFSQTVVGENQCDVNLLVQTPVEVSGLRFRDTKVGAREGVGSDRSLLIENRWAPD